MKGAVAVTDAFAQLSRSEALHVVRALTERARWARQLGVPLPRSLLERVAAATEWVTAVQEGDSRRPVSDHGPMLLTLSEVAAELRVSLSTAKRLVARGDLPVVLVTGRRRVRREDLERFIGPASFRDAVTVKAAS